MIAGSTLRLARPALAAFFAMGILWGSFAADLPDLKTMLGVGESRLGFLLLMTPIAAMLAMLAAPWVSERLGRVALPVTTLAMALAFALPGQVAVWFLFPIAMLACGATTGAVDVLMNARVSAMEQDSGQPLMNLCHAAYSFGYASGALGVGALRSAGSSSGQVMLAAAVGAGLVALSAFEPDGRIDGLRHPKGEKVSGLGMFPVMGGGIVLIAFLTENAAENWSALHIEQTLHGSPAMGSGAPAVLALTMGTARLLGQGLSARITPLRLMLGGAAVSAIGALTVAVAQSPQIAYAGFIVSGG
jgi:MFS family permease